MNDKDKEAFEEWFLNYPSWRATMSRQESCQKAWQAACDYKQKEIDELEESLAVRLAKSYIAGKDLSKIIQKNLTNEIEKLQAENAKLKEDLFLITSCDPHEFKSVSTSEISLQVLKELGDK